MIIQLKKNADVYDLMKQMWDWLPYHIEQASLIAELFDKGSCIDTAQDVFNYLQELNYKADDFKQIIQTPYRLNKTLSGDCKSYSIFAASIMAAIGYEVRFVYTCNNPNGMWHVYPQVKCNNEIITIDGTIDQFNYDTPATIIIPTGWMQLQ